MTTPLDLAEKWRALAAQQRQLGAEGQACTFEHCARELNAALKSVAHEELTIAEAAAESGYSEEQLRRLVRNDKLQAQPRAGPRSHLRIRRRDLPKRPKKRESSPSTCASGYDPEEDARSIAQLLEAKS